MADGWRRPQPPNAAELAAGWQGDGIEPELVERNGRLVNAHGRNPPVYPSGLTCRDYDDDDDDLHAAWLPEPDRVWADTIASRYKQRPPNRLPEVLPGFVSRDLVEFLRVARLSPDQIARFLRSPDQAGRLLCEYAENTASSFRRDGVRKKREMSLERAEFLLRRFLEMADGVRGIRRREAQRIAARLEDLRAQPDSRRRTELIRMYRAMLTTPERRDRDRERRKDIVAIFDVAAHRPAARMTRNSARHGWWLWDPTEADLTPETINKANSDTCGKTPEFHCALISRGGAGTAEV